MTKTVKNIFYAFAALILLGVVYFFYRFNPSTEKFFLPCPFKLITGYDCPGCGSQRAVHALLHGDVAQAFHFNPLFVIAIPYVIIGLIFNIQTVKEKYPKARKLLFGKKTIYLILTIILIFWVGRNL